jgi:Putative protein-S-isoprenylcysteine methyltransferase
VIGQVLLLGLVAVLGVQHVPAVTLDGPLDQLVLAVGIAEMAIGVWALLSAFRELGPNLTPLPRPAAHSSLVRSGIYARLRHPIYAGLMLASIGWATATRSLPAFASAVVLCLFLDVKARREEAWLVERYPEYAAYRLQTRRFLPGVY